MRDLNNGWPFSAGPDACGFRFEVRDGRVFCVCASCPQAVASVSEPLDVAADQTAPESYTVTLAWLKARVADHWLRCHAEEIEGVTYW